MATRLYPVTNNVSLCEKLAGVPAGTAAQYETFKQAEQLLLSLTAAPQTVQTEDVDFRLYDMMADCFPNIKQYDNFVVFGWGRMVMDLDYVGTEKDKNKMREILNAQNVDISDEDINMLDGLCWS